MDTQLFSIATGVSLQLALKWANPVSAAMQEFDIDTSASQAMFLAQIGVESWGFTKLSESFNYSPAGLLATFGGRVTAEQAQTLGRHQDEHTVPTERQEAIANLIYGGRFGNGPDEGWRYRGRGLMQITFRENYEARGKALGIDLVSNPDLLLREDLAARSAGWFWKAHNLNKWADLGNVAQVTKIINGGSAGLQDRIEKWEKAKRALEI